MSNGKQETPADCTGSAHAAQWVDVTWDDPTCREAQMVVIERDATGKPTVWCDPEIADLVRALNASGVRTIASCSGHGAQDGCIILADGRELVLKPDDSWRRHEQMTDGWLEDAFRRALALGNFAPEEPATNVLRGFANRVLQQFGNRDGMRDALNVAFARHKEG